MSFDNEEPKRDNLFEYIEDVTAGVDEEIAKENIEKRKPQTQIKYLTTQLETTRNLLAQKQEKLDELEEALKKSAFMPAHMIQPTMSVGLSAEDEFNVMHNPYWIVLH